VGEGAYERKLYPRRWMRRSRGQARVRDGRGGLSGAHAGAAAAALLPGEARGPGGPRSGS